MAKADVPVRRDIFVHPAVRIVEGVERLWTPDRQQAADRAMVVVARLIGAGFLTGTVERGHVAARPEPVKIVKQEPDDAK